MLLISSDFESLLLNSQLILLGHVAEQEYFQLTMHYTPDLLLKASNTPLSLASE